MAAEPSPTVSVIMPTYNRAHLVGQSIASVLAQTLQDFEIIVVDDGSVDGTDAVIAHYADSRLHYIYQSNHGLSSARNTSIRAARGHYMALLDSDDLWHPNWLAVAVATLEGNPAFGLVHADVQMVDSVGKPTPIKSTATEKYPGEPLKSLVHGDFLRPSATVIRKECFDVDGLFDENLRYNEDWDMWLRLARHWRIGHVRQIMVYKRHHDGQMTAAKATALLRLCADRTRVLDKAFADPDLPPDVAAIKPVAYSNLYLDLALRWFGAGGWREGLRWLGESVRVSPNPAIPLLKLARRTLFRRVSL